MPRTLATLGLLLAAVLALSACAEPRRVLDPLAKPAFEARIYVDAAGNSLPYRLYAPPGVTATASLPLLLMMHSITERGDDNGANLAFFQPEFKEDFYRQHPCVALVPQCPAGKYWWDKKVAAAVLAIVRQTVEAYPAVDARRLYMTGASLGGYAVYGLLKVQPQWWAAAVPLCGDPSPVPLDLRALKDQPLWIFHGAKDPRVSVKGDRLLVAKLKSLGSAVRYTEYPDLGHRIWTRAYAEPGLWDWVFAQKKEAPADFSSFAAL
jgi:predicted peptidase